MSSLLGIACFLDGRSSVVVVIVIIVVVFVFVVVVVVVVFVAIYIYVLGNIYFYCFFLKFVFAN